MNECIVCGILSMVFRGVCVWGGGVSDGPARVQGGPHHLPLESGLLRCKGEKVCFQ